jgi:hypothetical protein
MQENRISKKRYINIAAINTNGSPISTQIWTVEPLEMIANEVLARWMRDAYKTGEYPLVSAVATDVATHEVIAYRADGYGAFRLDNLKD